LVLDILVLIAALLIYDAYRVKPSLSEEVSTNNNEDFLSEEQMIEQVVPNEEMLNESTPEE
jgi:hypothetical protein